MRTYLCVILLPFVLSCHSGENAGAISASGTIETTEVNIAPKSPGQIASLRVDEGAVVHVGDTLAVIDSVNYVLNDKQAVAGIAQANAQLQLLEHGSRVEDIEQAQEQLNQAEAALKNARADVERIKGLLATHSVTQKQFDDADTRVVSAQAAYNAAMQMHHKLKAGARPEDIEAAKARVNQIRSQADLIQQQLSDCIIKSPVAGMVTHKVLNQGEMAAMGSTIITVSVLDPVILTIFVSDKDLGKVKLGQHAKVSIDTYKDRSFDGVVTYISPTAEFTPKNVQTTEDRQKLVFGVKIEVPNHDGSLKPGMPADAVLQ